MVTQVNGSGGEPCTIEHPTRAEILQILVSGLKHVHGGAGDAQKSLLDRILANLIIEYLDDKGYRIVKAESFLQRRDGA